MRWMNIKFEIRVSKSTERKRNEACIMGCLNSKVSWRRLGSDW